MATRDPDLQAFLDAARAAFGEFAQDPASRGSLARIFNLALLARLRSA